MDFRKKAVGAALAAMLTFGAVVPAFAHDGWTQSNTPIVAPNAVSYVELMLGNHSNEHKSYRIAGQWSVDTSKVYVTMPAGVKADITSTRFYAGEAATETEPGVNNYFIASFKSAVPGAYIISAEGDSISRHGAAPSRTLRSAKSFVAIGDIPVMERVKALEGFSKQVSPDRAELIPLFNPASVTPGEDVAVQLLLKGEPLANTNVDIIRRSTSEAVELVTDEQGYVSFTTGLADYYLVRAKPSTTESKGDEYGSTNYEATMTFTVQNESPKLPGHPSIAIPHIYLNGSLVEAEGTALNKGVTMVNADFIRQYVNKDFAGNGPVSLRSAIEQSGAVIEYFPAVGDLRAAVAIYTK